VPEGYATSSNENAWKHSDRFPPIPLPRRFTREGSLVRSQPRPLHETA
jgi:hypothetical protein